MKPDEVSGLEVVRKNLIKLISTFQISQYKRGSINEEAERDCENVVAVLVDLLQAQETRHQSELQAAERRWKAEALNLIAKGEGWEESRGYYAEKLHLQGDKPE